MKPKYDLSNGIQLDDQLYEIIQAVSARYAEDLDRSIAEFYLAQCKIYPDLTLRDLVLIEDSSKPLEVKIAVHPDVVLRHRRCGEGEPMKSNKNGDIFDLSAEATYTNKARLLALGFDPLTLKESAASTTIAEKEGTMKQPDLHTIYINGVDVTAQVVIGSVCLICVKPEAAAHACEFSLCNATGQLSFYGPSLDTEEGTLRHKLWRSRTAKSKRLLVPTMHVLAYAEKDPMSVMVYDGKKLVFDGHVTRADARHSTQTIDVSCALGCVEKGVPSPLDPMWALEAEHCKAYFNGNDAAYNLEGVVGWDKTSATFYPAHATLKYFTDLIWNDGACTVKVYHEDHEEVPSTLVSASGHSSSGTSTILRRILLFSGTVVHFGKSTHDENRVVCWVGVDRAYPPPVAEPVQKVDLASNPHGEVPAYFTCNPPPSYGTQVSVPDAYTVNFPGDADPSTVLELHLPHRGPDDANPRLQPVLVVKADGSVEVKPGWGKRMDDLAMTWWRAMAKVYHALPLPVSPKQEAIIAWCKDHHMDLAEFDRHYYAVPGAGETKSKRTGEYLGPCWEIVKIKE